MQLTYSAETVMLPPEKQNPGRRTQGFQIGAVTPDIVKIDTPTIPAPPPIATENNLLSGGNHMSKPFTKLMTDTALELLENDPNTFLLLSQIALRARRKESKFDDKNLQPGQALIGDHRTIGLSRQQYRDCQAKLLKWKIATFQGTNKGTIATLISTEIYDINLTAEEPPKEPNKNQQRTTNKECKKERDQKKKNSKKEKSFLEFGSHVRLTAEEHAKLAQQQGPEALAGLIEDMNDWCASKGKSFADYAAALRTWHRKRVADAALRGKPAADSTESNRKLAQTYAKANKGNPKTEVEDCGGHVEIRTPPFCRAIPYTEKGFSHQLEAECRKANLIIPQTGAS